MHGFLYVYKWVGHLLFLIMNYRAQFYQVYRRKSWKHSIRCKEFTLSVKWKFLKNIWFVNENLCWKMNLISPFFYNIYQKLKNGQFENRLAKQKFCNDVNFRHLVICRVCKAVNLEWREILTIWNQLRTYMYAVLINFTVR